jgi:hypothetical protein
MCNRRVSKSRVEPTAPSTNSTPLTGPGLSPHAFIREALLPIQQQLVTVMGELATAVDDLPRVADGYSRHQR